LWLRLLVTVGIAVALPIGAAAAVPPDRTPPRIKTAVMKDTDHDGKADVLLLTYTERVTHLRDSDGRYPFKVAGYRLRSVGRASGKTIALALVEKAAPDGTAKPGITYRRTVSKPVRDRARNQAKAQTFRGTQPTGFDPDTDHDGYLAPDDCAPNDPAILRAPPTRPTSRSWTRTATGSTATGPCPSSWRRPGATRTAA
jgi:hypothetical protein